MTCVCKVCKMWSFFFADCKFVVQEHPFVQSVIGAISESPSKNDKSCLIPWESLCAYSACADALNALRRLWKCFEPWLFAVVKKQSHRRNWWSVRKCAKLRRNQTCPSLSTRRRQSGEPIVMFYVLVAMTSIITHSNRKHFRMTHHYSKVIRLFQLKMLLSGAISERESNCVRCNFRNTMSKTLSDQMAWSYIACSRLIILFLLYFT